MANQGAQGASSACKWLEEMELGSTPPYPHSRVSSWVKTAFLLSCFWWPKWKANFLSLLPVIALQCLYPTRRSFHHLLLPYGVFIIQSHTWLRYCLGFLKNSKECDPQADWTSPKCSLMQCGTQIRNYSLPQDPSNPLEQKTTKPPADIELNACIIKGHLNHGVRLHLHVLAQGIHANLNRMSSTTGFTEDCCR